MMLAGQAVLGGVGQHVAHHAAQRVLGQEVVADVIDGHGADSDDQMAAHECSAPAENLASVRRLSCNRSLEK